MNSFSFYLSDHIWTNWQVVAKEVHKGEWHGEGAQEDIGDGQRGDQHIPGGQHHLKVQLFRNCLHYYIVVISVDLI